MTLDYRKTFEIEIINEFQSAIHSKMLNFILNNEFDKSDSKNPQRECKIFCVNRKKEVPSVE